MRFLAAVALSKRALIISSRMKLAFERLRLIALF